jgi:hypothetical protein
MRSLPYLLKNDNNSWCACEPKLEEEEFVTPKKVFNSQVVFQCQCMAIFVKVQPISWVDGEYRHKENVAIEKPVWWKGNNQPHAFAFLHMSLQMSPHASSAFIQLPVCLAQHNFKMRIKNPGLLFKSFKETYHSVCALLQQHESEQKKPVLLFRG